MFGGSHVAKAMNTYSQVGTMALHQSSRVILGQPRLERGSGIGNAQHSVPGPNFIVKKKF